MIFPTIPIFQNNIPILWGWASAPVPDAADAAAEDAVRPALPALWDREDLAAARDQPAPWDLWGLRALRDRLAPRVPSVSPAPLVRPVRPARLDQLGLWELPEPLAQPAPLGLPARLDRPVPLVLPDLPVTPPPSPSVP